MKLYLGRMLSNFYSGVIKKDEFEELLNSIVKKRFPDVQIQEIIYGKRGVILNTGSEFIEIEVDFEEIILEE